MRVIALVISIVVAVAATGCSTARDQPPSEPLPHRMTPVWSAEVRTDDPLALFVVTDTAVVIPAHGNGLATTNMTVRNPRTGRIKTTISADPGWSFERIDVRGAHAYAILSSEESGMTRLADYDLRNGRIAWRTDLAIADWALPGSVFSNSMTVAPGGIMLRTDRSGAAYGLRPDDGKVMWSKTVPGCVLGDSWDSSASVQIQCPATGPVRLVSIEPATGRIGWQRTLAQRRNGPCSPDVKTTDDGEILAKSGNVFRLFAPDGRLIATRKLGKSCVGVQIGVHSSTAVIDLGDNTDRVVQGIDLRTGRQRWQRTGVLTDFDYLPMDAPAVVAVSGGTLFASAGTSLVGDPTLLLPKIVVAIQPTTGRTTVLPLASSQVATYLIGSAAGLLFATSESAKGSIVTAYRPDATGDAPPALGGTPSSEWPDTCALLTPADLRKVGRGYVSVPKNPPLSGVRWPKPTICSHVGRSPHDPVVTVSTAWIAASTEQAHQLFTSELAALDNQTNPPSRIGKGAYLVPDGALPNQANRSDRVLILAGRAIARITVPGHPNTARRLAPLVAARLHARYG